MHLTLIETIRANACRTARPVFGTLGQPIIEPDTLLRAEHLAELKRFGIDKAVVVDEETRDVSFTELMDSHAWIRLATAMREVYTEACSDRLAGETLYGVAHDIERYAAARSPVVPLPSRSVPAGLQPYAHVVNVAIWAVQAAKFLSMPEPYRQELIVGCLLHDVGKLLADRDDSAHPLVGFLFAREWFPAGSIIPPIILHHQNVAGDAYRGQSIPKPYAEAAKLCYLSNLFDHLSDVSESMYEGALDVLLTLPDRLFASRETKALASVVPKYLPGSTLRTASGRTAIVMKLTPEDKLPLLRIRGTQEFVTLTREQLATVELVRL